MNDEPRQGKRDIVIAGGGFAGVWAAAAAAKVRNDAGLDACDLPITLVSRSNCLEIRPRLYETPSDDMAVPLAEILRPVHVRLIVSEIEAVEASAQSVRIKLAESGGVEHPSRLVLATGSQIVRPDDRLLGPAAFDIDTLAGAQKLERHLQTLAGRNGPGCWTVLVVGSGFTGTELATELPRRLIAHGGPPKTIRVIVVEKAGVVAPELGVDLRQNIMNAFASLGIEVRAGATIAACDGEKVVLSTGEVIATSTVVWTAGMRANPLAGSVGASVDKLGRLLVNEYLQVPNLENLYAAGDVAAAQCNAGNISLQSCQHAQVMGRFAGHNAAADILGLKREIYRQPLYVTCLDLGGAGAAFSVDWKREVLKVGDEAKSIKEKINRHLVYPPRNDARALLAAATPIVRSREAGLQRILEG